MIGRRHTMAVIDGHGNMNQQQQRNDDSNEFLPGHPKRKTLEDNDDEQHGQEFHGEYHALGVMGQHGYEKETENDGQELDGI